MMREQGKAIRLKVADATLLALRGIDEVKKCTKLLEGAR
jgi:hypothetical protein